MSIVLKKSDGFIDRDMIKDKFKVSIKDYYNIDHDVNFDDIKRSFYSLGGDSVTLDYRFSSGEVPEMKSSIHNTVLDMCEEIYTREPKLLDLDKCISEILDGKTNYADLSELQSVYIGMKFDQLREVKGDNDWNILKDIVRNKIRNLFTNKKNGTYHEMKLVDFKLDKLKKFNLDKHKFVERRLKRNGKTLSNFVEATKEWNISYKNKLDFNKFKHSMELKTDLAFSGLEDDLV